MANPLEMIGAQGGFSGLQNFYAGNMQKPVGTGPVNNPAVYGSVPAPVQPYSTGPQVTAQAIGAGQQAYGQLPNYNADISTLGTNINSEVSGQLPADVVNQIAQAGAERGVATGSPGSPNANASYLQSLGLNSLQLEQTGQSNLENLLPTLPGSAISQNPNFYVNPGLIYGAGETNALDAAAPNPYAAAMANLSALGGGMGAGNMSSGGLPAPTVTPNIPGAGVVTGSGPPGMNMVGGNAVTDDQLAQMIQKYQSGALTPEQANQQGQANDQFGNVGGGTAGTGDDYYAGAVPG